MFVVYSKDNCSFCQQAKNLLLMKNEKFEVKKLNVDYTLEDFIDKFPEQKTFPMVVHKVDESYVNIGGFDKLKEFFDANR